MFTLSFPTSYFLTVAHIGLYLIQVTPISCKNTLFLGSAVSPAAWVIPSVGSAVCQTLVFCFLLVSVFDIMKRG